MGISILDRSRSSPADVVVAADGSGNYTTITAAVAAVPLKISKRYVIHIKMGVYKEKCGRRRPVNIRNVHHYSITVDGNGFMARDLTIENTAVPVKKQVVALLSNSDNSVVYRCIIRGYQDTLYVKNKAVLP
uniref:Pectinesterase catalytic domain-containing protein n=1 Tax=Leersia perrieri TaxID=77586 RepID=A0A0D9XG95_9ORYZ